MDTDALRWFQLVADGVTVTEVSELEGVSQPGVSRALARLEAELGTPLLRRSGRTLRMTHAGSTFKRHVDALLHQLDDGLAAVEQVVDPERGRVAFEFPASLGSWLVPDLVSSFRVAHPAVRYRLSTVRDDRVESVLAAGHADLVLSTVRSTDETVHRQRLLDQPLRLAVSAGHRLAEQRDVPLTEAANEPFLMLRPKSPLRRLCLELCREAGFEPTVSFEGEDISTLQGFVAAGLGVAIIPAAPEGWTEPGSGRLRYLRITDVPAVREIGLVWARDRRLLPAAELFREHVLDRARAQRLPAVA